MARVNVEKTIKKISGKINPFYDLYTDQMYEINNMSNDRGELIGNAFILGYMKGVKAQKKGRAFKWATN